MWTESEEGERRGGQIVVWPSVAIRARGQIERQSGQAWMGPGRDTTTSKSLGPVRRSSKD
eukprot:5910220-Prymnesium_polylepis.1